MRVVGRELARLRVENEFRVIDVSDALRMSPSAISNIEHGRQWAPLHVIRAMASLYAVGLVRFFEGVEERL
jgi:transcriptional regulator with XRE-family HTH domain